MPELIAPRSYCHACGTYYGDDQIAHGDYNCRQCPNPQCRTTSWNSPTPIGVLLQPVYQLFYEPGQRYATTRVGLLVGTRGIPPMLGGLGLPGGFTDPADPSYEQGALRERCEEVVLGQVMAQDEALDDEEPQLLFSTRGDPGQIIAFSYTQRAWPLPWLATHLPNPECPAVSVIWGPADLCFSSHTAAARRWFAEGLTNRGDFTYLGRRDYAAQVEADHRAVQAACQHNWVDAPELYNHHKGEDYQRCTVCGEVV